MELQYNTHFQYIVHFDRPFPSVKTLRRNFLFPRSMVFTVGANLLKKLDIFKRAIIYIVREDD